MRGCVLCDADDRVLNMEEKSERPKSHWCCPPFYYYTEEDAGLIKKEIELVVEPMRRAVLWLGCANKRRCMP